MRCAAIKCVFASALAFFLSFSFLVFFFEEIRFSRMGSRSQRNGESVPQFYGSFFFFTRSLVRSYFIAGVEQRSRGSAIIARPTPMFPKENCNFIAWKTTKQF